MRDSQRLRLIRWLQVIIINSGFHDADRASRDNERVYSVNAHSIFDKYEWKWDHNQDQDTRTIVGHLLTEKWTGDKPGKYGSSTIVAKVQGWGRAVRIEDAMGADEVHADLTARQDATKGEVILAGHPRLHHGPTLLIPRDHYREELTRKVLRTGLTRALVVQRCKAISLSLLLDRLHRAGDRDPVVQAAIRSRTIHELQSRAEGETDYQAIFRYRLAMGALNIRDNTGEPVPCPHAWCSREGRTATITHILWTCDAARRTWSLVYRQWTRRADPVQPDDLLRSSVGVELPVLARAIRQAMRDEFEDRRTMIATTRQAWRIIQAVVPHQLWLHRNAAAFQATTDSVHGVAAKIWAAISRQLGSFAAAQRMTSTTCEEGRAMEEILRGLSADEPAETCEHGEARVYYDGGARGNSGRSGAGAVLLERHSENRSWEIVWWAATYVGDHSTNNVAEHQALAQGLRRPEGTGPPD